MQTPSEAVSINSATQDYFHGISIIELLSARLIQTEEIHWY